MPLLQLLLKVSISLTRCRGAFSKDLGETETEPELPDLPSNGDIPAVICKPRSDSAFSIQSHDSVAEKENVTLPATRKRSKTVSMHDLRHRFFRQPMIVLSRIDIFR